MGFSCHSLKGAPPARCVFAASLPPPRAVVVHDLLIDDSLHAVQREQVDCHLHRAVADPPVALHVVPKLVEHAPVALSLHFLHVQCAVSKVHMRHYRVARMHVPHRDCNVHHDPLLASPVRRGSKLLMTQHHGVPQPNGVGQRRTALVHDPLEQAEDHTTPLHLSPCARALAVSFSYRVRRCHTAAELNRNGLRACAQRL
jgi:hypothetical protein